MKVEASWLRLSRAEERAEEGAVVGLGQWVRQDLTGPMGETGPGPMGETGPGPMGETEPGPMGERQDLGQWVRQDLGQWVRQEASWLRLSRAESCAEVEQAS